MATSTPLTDWNNLRCNCTNLVHEQGSGGWGRYGFSKFFFEEFTVTDLEGYTVIGWGNIQM